MTTEDLQQPQGKSRFILTQPIAAEEEEVRSLLHNIRTAFLDRDCLVYWRYPLFLSNGATRKAPDILMLDRELGMVVLERLETAEDPEKALVERRALKYLEVLLAGCDRHPLLKNSVTGRTFLPFAKGSTDIYLEIFQTVPKISTPPLTETQWQLLKQVISGATVFQQNHSVQDCSANYSVEPLSVESLNQAKSRVEVMAKVRSQLHAWDEQQEILGKQIPPGVQRIRGIAGSGKTVLLCQKAAHIHLAHPDWEIALVFFTRSLYDLMESWVDRWLRHFSNGEVSYDETVRQKLRILHAWGGQRAGFYGAIATAHDITPLRVSDTPHKLPHEGLAYACRHLLQNCTIQPQFDAVLIDEGQDLVVEDKHKFADQGELYQPFYWLAYQSCRPLSFSPTLPSPDLSPSSPIALSPSSSKQRRLIWAYDEAQSLNNLKIPTAKELFGDRLSSLVTGFHPGGIPKSVILRRCYRNPGGILTTAHAVGMGLLRPAGMVRGLTTKADWEAIGYEIKSGSFQPPGQRITLHRPLQNSPNPTPMLWGKSVLELTTYETRVAELSALVERLRHHLAQEQVQPSRDVLVLVLGGRKEAIALETQVAKTLMRANIPVYIASATQPNKFPAFPRQFPDQFWHSAGVTLSRMNRAKGNEAPIVYAVGLDHIAENEGNPLLRNQLYVAMTRSQGWLFLSGVGEQPLYEEVRGAMLCQTAKPDATSKQDNGFTLTWQFQPPH